MCAKFKLLFISTFQIEKKHVLKSSHIEIIPNFYVRFITNRHDQPSNQATNKQNPEVEKLLCTMQNLSCLHELINGAVHHDYLRHPMYNKKLHHKTIHNNYNYNSYIISTRYCL